MKRYPVKTEDGDEMIFNERTELVAIKPKKGDVVKSNRFNWLWFIIHNLIAHPLLIFNNRKSSLPGRFHDWTESKMNPDAKMYRQNCLEYALIFWSEQPTYEIWYNSGHCINLPIGSSAEGFLPADGFGYIYFSSAFKGLLSEDAQELLIKYFERKKLNK